MRLSRLVFSLVPLLAAAPVASQESVTSVYAEALGPTEFMSLNLERIAGEGWALRGGLQVAGSGRSLGEHFAQIPVSIARIEFLRGFGLEAGVGSVFTINGQYSYDVFETFGSAAIRTPPLFGGAFLRVEGIVMPSEAWRKTAGVAIGYAF